MKTFKDILKPGVERIRAFVDGRFGSLTLKRGEAAEVDEHTAFQAVNAGTAGYATRVELLKPIPPIGRESVEPGVGAVVEVSAAAAIRLEQEGMGKPAAPLNAPPAWPIKAGPIVKLRVDLPVKPPASRASAASSYSPTLFVAPLGRSYSRGDVFELPAELARRFVVPGVAKLEPGYSLPRLAQAG